MEENQNGTVEGRLWLAHRPSRLALYLSISALIGMLITAIVGLSTPDGLTVWGVLVGAVIGLIIGGGALLGETLTLRLLRPRSATTLMGARIVGYGVGGALGYAAAGVFVDWAFPHLRWDMGSPVWVPSAFFGGFSVLVGFVFQAFEVLRSRLEASVAKLKEAEFAAKELQTARDFQRRLLPPQELTGPGFALSARNRPARIVAGDLYDYFELPGGKLAFAIGDVSGKGLGASLIMATVQARLPLVFNDDPLEQVAHRLNSQLCEDLDRREFVALILARFDPQTGCLEWLNAGLPDPIIIDAQRTGFRDQCSSGDRRPLGLRRDASPQGARIQLSPGERVFFYTDGLPESHDTNGNDGPRGYEWLNEAIASLLTEDDLGTALLDRAQPAEVARSADTAQEALLLQDDCTTLVLDWHGAPLAEDGCAWRREAALEI